MHNNEQLIAFATGNQALMDGMKKTTYIHCIILSALPLARSGD